MKKSKGLLVSIVIGVSVLIIFGQSTRLTSGISQSLVQGSQSAKTDSEQVTTREAFWKTLIAARVPGGIIWQRSCGKEEIKGQRVPSGSSLRATLNGIVQADPEYVWSDEKGAINLLPATGEPDLLKTRIREFRIGKVPHLNLALESLLALPEVSKAAASLQLNQGLKLGGLSSPGQDQVTLNVYRKNVTLLEALNAIARAHGSAVWQYSEWQCSAKTEFSIEFLVE